MIPSNQMCLLEILIGIGCVMMKMPSIAANDYNGNGADIQCSIENSISFVSYFVSMPEQTISYKFEYS